MPKVMAALEIYGLSICALVVKIWPDKVVRWCLDGKFLAIFCVLCFERASCSTCMYVLFGQGSSLLWIHTLRPLYSRPIVLTQEGRSQVDDVCECMHD